VETHSGRRIAGQARAPGLISVYVATCSAALNRDLGTWARVGYCYRIRILMYLDVSCMYPRVGFYTCSCIRQGIRWSVS